MRKIIPITSAMFSLDNEKPIPVNLPHTWNNLDGQDGGSDYRRTVGHYELNIPEVTPGKRQFIQFNGANHIATVFCNGKELGTHEGGFSVFRFELTPFLNEKENKVTVNVDNRENHVYPQHADFTFFGGLYRDVSIIEVDDAHFNLMKKGSSAVFITPFASGKVRVDAFPVNADGYTVRCKISDMHNVQVSEFSAAAENHTVLTSDIPNPHLWQGVCDPYLYNAVISLENENGIIDEISVSFGFRSFHVDPENGFFLNGKSHPLRGVCRHQDRLDKGWAISKAEHDEDLAIIQEVGANTIRLAHYQHDSYFYDICDKAGMVLWAEIPFITIFMEDKKSYDNTISQMEELIAQNYNHPSICFWGIANEITIGGESEALYRNLCDLNALVKKLDPSRLTTIAEVSMVPMESEYVYITDVVSYNHYFGWYSGEVEENGPWFDEFHRKNPDRPFGISEYGAEAILSWHSEKPENHDYTEEYQAYYHHQMLETFAERSYLWATHVWNMFDFAADARDEGGCKGRNNKGLVTYDRKTRKDAFFVYKAYWTTEPMVHICGSRFVDRAPGQRDITVYTNCPEVTLFINGEKTATQTVNKHMAVFKEVSLINGKNIISVKASNAPEDTIILNGVDDPNTSYILPRETSSAGNWFDELNITDTEFVFNEGFFSIRDKIGDIMDHPEASIVLQQIFQKLSSGSTHSQNSSGMMKMLRSMKLEDILRMVGRKMPVEAKVYINNTLNKIKK